MLIHLEKRSSATMCSYSLWTAHCRRLVLWWRSYRLHKAEGMRVSAGTEHREECQPQPGPGRLDGKPHFQPTLALSASVSSCATAPLPPRLGHRGSPAVSALTDGAGTRHKGKTMVGPASGGSHAGAWAWGSCPPPPETDDWALQGPQLRILSSRSPAPGSLQGRGQGSSAGPKAHTAGHCVTTEPQRSHRHHWGQLSPERHVPNTTRSSQLGGVYSSSGATLALWAGQSMLA